MCKLTEKIIEDIKNSLSEKRYAHTLGVADMAEKLAGKWNGDIEKAKIAALLHDSEKETDISKLREITKNIENQDKIPDNVLHGFAASITARDKYGIEDQDILNAVAYHTTGRNNMSVLEKIIFVADLVEETRSYDRVEEIREMAFENIDKAVYEKIQFAVYKCEKNNLPVHPLTLEAKKYIINKLEVNS